MKAWSQGPCHCPAGGQSLLFCPRRVTCMKSKNSGTLCLDYKILSKVLANRLREAMRLFFYWRWVNSQKKSEWHNRENWKQNSQVEVASPPLSYRGRTLVHKNLVASVLWHRLTFLEEGLLAQIQTRVLNVFWNDLHWFQQGSWTCLERREGRVSSTWPPGPPPLEFSLFKGF